MEPLGGLGFGKLQFIFERRNGVQSWAPEFAEPHALIHKRNTRTVVTCGGCEPCGLLHDCGSIPRTDLDLSVFRTFGESWLFANAMVVSWHSWKAIEFTVSETLSAEAIELTVTATLSARSCMAWPTMDLWLASASRTCMRWVLVLIWSAWPAIVS